ncbi:MAG: hypothetical protein L0287_15670 [Anaerolineae bacterium]|nr:hypothetical protein [Anaerolineae bacterium]
MNHYQDECTAEYNRQRIKDEIKQIRLEQFALKSWVAKPGRFARMMFNFANWMISTGKQLQSGMKSWLSIPAGSRER